MNDLFWIVSGLVISTASAIVSTAHGDLKPYVKGLLTLLATLGLAVGSGYAVRQNNDKTASESREKALQGEVAKLTVEAGRISTGVGALQLKAEDLVALNQMAGDNARYYVQIAAGGTSKELEGSRSRLRNQFGIPRVSNIVAIIDRERLGFRNQVKTRYALVFGHHQTLTAAEVFQRLANSHHLPPADGFASINVEPADFANAIVQE